MERSKIKTSFEMNMENDWVVNHIENEDGSKLIEVGTPGFFPALIHFGFNEEGERFINVHSTLAPDRVYRILEWPETNG